eukprot:8145128-Lingulodinium_polyedra.AAC.1
MSEACCVLLCTVLALPTCELGMDRLQCNTAGTITWFCCTHHRSSSRFSCASNQARHVQGAPSESASE